MPELPLEKLKGMVVTAADLTNISRQQAERDRDYYDGHQWTPQQRAALEARKQPVITINRVQRKIDAMVGIEARSRVDPRAFPRTPQDEQAADVATKALVYVEDVTRFDGKRSAAFENLLVEGYGGVEIVVEEKRGKLEIAVNRLRWEEIFYDPHSREKDFSDASYVGVIKWMTVDQAAELYAEGYDEESVTLEELLETSLGDFGGGDTYEDRPLETHYRWGDKRLRRVRVAQMYYRRGGVWYLAAFTGGGVLMHMESPYLDEDGKTTCPIILMTAYIDRENRRYGMVRSMISAQDEINARRSKLLHQLNTRQTQAIRGVISAEDVRREKGKPDAHFELDPLAVEGALAMGMRPFEFINNNDQVAGQFNLLTESKAEIDMMGPNASLLGEVQGQQSGRAIMAQQQAGLVEVAPIYDSLRDWTLRCYRAMWNRIRQFWTDERWIRITDEMEAPQFLAVNVFRGMDPMTMQPIVENAVAEMDLDIIIDEAPDFVTLRHEQFEQLSQMMQAGVPIPPEMLIETSNLRDKARIMEQIKAAQEQQMQMQMAQMQNVQQLEGVKAQTEAEGRMARARRDDAAAVKDTVDARLRAIGL